MTRRCHSHKGEHMTDLRQAAQQALEALEMLARYENPETKIQVRKPKDGGPIVTMYPHKVATDAGVALRTAIAEAEKQEPVAWRHEKFYEGASGWFYADWHSEGLNPPSAQLLYTTPPAAQRPWVGLTNKEIAEILCDDRWQMRPELMLLACQAKLKERNT